MGSVLVVDDDLEIRLAITQVLEHEGYDVSCVSNGKEGLDFLEKSKPQLILLDLMMPVMDGWQFKSQISGSPQLSKIPIVILSANGRAKDQSSVDSEGAVEYLQKPVQIQTLLETVRTYCV